MAHFLRHSPAHAYRPIPEAAPARRARAVVPPDVALLSRFQSLAGGSGAAEFTPDVCRALRVDISAAWLLSGFSCLTVPFTGLILRRDLEATPFQLSIMAAASAACLLLSLGWARVVDGRRPLPYVVWPGFVARALFLLAPLVTSAWPLIAILVAGNFCGAVSSPAQAALVQRVYPHAQRGRALGRVRMAAGLPGIALAIAGGALLALVHYRWLFPMAALLGMAASLRLRQMPVPEGGQEPVERTGLREAWATVREDTGFRALLTTHFLFGAGIWMQMPANPLLLADVLHATTMQLGLCAALAAVAAFVGNAYWGRLIDRVGSARTLRAVYAVGAVTPLLYYTAWSPWVLLVTAVLESVMTTGLDLVWMLAVIDVAGRGRTTQYMAISVTLAGVRGVGGPLLSGFVIAHAGVHAVYLIAAATMTLAACLMSRQVAVATRRALSGAPVRRLGGSPAA